jgi:hypothetical protein
MRSLLRLNKGLQVYAAIKGTGNNSAPAALTKEDLESLAELEALMGISQAWVVVAQYEKNFLGAFSGLIQDTMIREFSSDTLRMLSLQEITASHTDNSLPHKTKKVSELTAIGKTARDRAILECQRRFCGTQNRTEEIKENIKVEISEREMMARMVDPRIVAVASEQFDPTDVKRWMKLLEDEYVKFGMRAYAYERNKDAAADASHVELSGVSITTDTPVSGKRAREDSAAGAAAGDIN